MFLISHFVFELIRKLLLRVFELNFEVEHFSVLQITLVSSTKFAYCWHINYISAFTLHVENLEMILSSDEKHLTVSISIAQSQFLEKLGKLVPYDFSKFHEIREKQ